MKLPFERESVYEPEVFENLALPAADRIRVHVRWPNVLEDSLIPSLEYIQEPLSEPEIVDGRPTGRMVPAMIDELDEAGAPTGEKRQRTIARATDKSLAVYTDHILRHHVPRIENLEGIASGAELADGPLAPVEPLVWELVRVFRAGPAGIVEKKTD